MNALKIFWDAPRFLSRWWVPLILAGRAVTVPAEDLFRIDFEDYEAGELADVQPAQAEMFRWQVPKGTARIQTEVAHQGKRALRMGPARSLAMRRFDGGTGVGRLTAETQYYDFWIYPDTEISDYIVVARLTDVTGSSFADIHFAEGGRIKALVGTNRKDPPFEMMDLDGRWAPEVWQRVTLKFGVTRQVFDLYLNGKLCTPGGQPFAAKFTGRLSQVMLEGPHAAYSSFAAYYDDLRWSDTDPLASK